MAKSCAYSSSSIKAIEKIACYQDLSMQNFHNRMSKFGYLEWYFS